MALSPTPRTAFAEVAGKHWHDHKLAFDPPTGIRNSNQRNSSSQEIPQKSTNHTAGRGSGESVGEEKTSEDDDEDSSAQKEDEQEDEDDDPEAFAPSHGRGLGKGKRPAIRIEHGDGDESQEDNEETSFRGTGLKTGKHPVNQVLMRNKKRTFSNVSNNSVLFGENEDVATEQHAFPRRKMARKLSNSSAKGLLTYKKNTMHGSDNAVESSDDEGKEPIIDLDDEDYSGVNLISDESDMEDVEQEEENWIISDTKQTDLFKDARRLSLESSASDSFFDQALPMDENYFPANALPDVGFGHFFNLDDTAEASPEPTGTRKYSDSSAKRVRFDDEVQVSDSSSSSSSELDSGLWPDLFMDQDKLPPSLFQLIEADNDADEADFPSSGSEHSYWDFGQDESHNMRFDSDEFDDSSSDPGSSGYETDLGGDTTDEYDSDASLAPQTPREKKSVLRQPSSAPGSKAASPRPYQRSERPSGAKPTGKFLPPICGVFIHGDCNQAIAVTNKSTKALTFFRPRTSISLRYPSFVPGSNTSSTSNNSPRASLQHFNADDSDFSEVMNNPFQSPTDIMLTGIFGSAPPSNYLLGGSTVGPPEAFYPFISVASNGNINIMSDEDEYDEDEFEDDVKITDFMDFGSDADDTDMEQDEETDVPATPATSMVALNGSTPAQPTPMTETPTNRKRNASDVMLEHFDRGVVTAFRNNQSRYRDLACLPHDPDLRASVSKPLRSGRSAEALISPLRKRSSMPKARKMGPPRFAGVTKATSRLQSSMMDTRRGPRMGTFS